MGNDIGYVVEVLRSGGLVVFPTDTVWGVGALASSEQGVKKLYQVMKRPKNKPTAILVDGMAMAEKYGEINDMSRKLMQKYWPGGLTVIVKAKQENVLELVRGGGDTVGLRQPDHTLVLELLDQLGEGIVASSANVLGGNTPARWEEIDRGFLEQADAVMKGLSGNRKASSVVDTCGSKLKVVREGEIKIA